MRISSSGLSCASENVRLHCLQCQRWIFFGPKKIQRWHCKQCKRTFSEEQDKPLDEMRISMDRAEMCLKLLLEGMSIRSVQRITGLHQETILSLIVLVGDKCE